MISSKIFASDGSNTRFLSDFIIRSEQFCRVYNYVYDADGVDGDTDTASGLKIRILDVPQSEDLITIDKWDLVDNSISFYTSPYSGSRVYIEVATTAEEFGNTLVQPAVERAEEAAIAAEASEVAAEAAQLASETAQGLSETAQGLSETAQGLSEVAQAASEAAQAASEAAQAASELAETGSEAAQVAAEAAQLASETAQANAEAAQLAAEVAKADAETAEAAALVSEQNAEAWAATLNPTNYVSQTGETASAEIPTGTTAQRDGVPTQGMFRFNADDIVFEGYNGTIWGPVGGGAKGGGTDDVFYENSQNVTTDYTLTASKNAVSAGPVAIDNGVTVTVPDGANWSVV